MTARPVLAMAMDEADLQTNILDLCKVYGLLVFHPFDSRRSAPGWPDLAIVGSRLLLRELKSVRGRLSADQRRWLFALADAGQDVQVWTPVHWLDGTIARELAAIRRREVAP